MSAMGRLRAVPSPPAERGLRPFLLLGPGDRDVAEVAVGLPGQGVAVGRDLVGQLDGHEGTWIRGRDCYLEDLFVDADARGKGLGRALIDDLIATSKAKGWSREALAGGACGTGGPMRSSSRCRAC